MFQPNLANVPLFAGFWVRTVAYIIDALVVGVPLGIIEGAVASGGSSGATTVVYLLGIAAGAAYFVYFWSSTGQTLGMRAVGVRVVSADSGEVIPTSAAFIRYLGLIVSSLVFALGLIWVAIDPRKQGWHDKMANTLVIRSGAGAGQ